MYIPHDNQMTDLTEILAFMRKFSFASIITAKDNLPVATHLPFVVSEENGKISLISHFARANPQWKDLETNSALVIFSEPHAYISPRHYEHEVNVPTWNYLSVHAYGKATLIHEADKLTELLEITINNYESEFFTQWKNLPLDYRNKLMKGIVGFKIEVQDLQAKKKLSQNKTEIEKRNIIEALSKSEDSNEREIGSYMEGIDNKV